MLEAACSSEKSDDIQWPTGRYVPEDGILHIHNVKHFGLISDSAVGIGTGYEMKYRGVGVQVPVGSRIFSSPLRPDQILGSSWGVKRPRCEAGYSPPPSAEIKKYGSVYLYAMFFLCLTN
jgi:hypothetical protein